MISLTDIHKSFGPLKVLKGIDLEFSAHSVHAILGPNGSGKTTLIKILLGMVRPDKGEVHIHNRRVNDDWEYRKDIDYVPQIARFPENLKVKELIRMLARFRKKKERSEELIALFGIQTLLDQKLNTLSGGSRQKVNLVLAFMFDSPVIILDEPTSGLDPLSVKVLKELIRKERLKGKIILMTTHIMGLVEELADNIVFLMEGKVLYDGSVEELQSRNSTLKLEDAIAGMLEEEYA